MSHAIFDTFFFKLNKLCFYISSLAGKSVILFAKSGNLISKLHFLNVFQIVFLFSVVAWTQDPASVRQTLYHWARCSFVDLPTSSSNEHFLHLNCLALWFTFPNRTTPPTHKWHTNRNLPYGSGAPAFADIIFGGQRF